MFVTNYCPSGLVSYDLKSYILRKTNIFILSSQHLKLPQKLLKILKQEILLEKIDI